MKEFWKSKVLWTQVFAVLLALLSALALPPEYKTAVLAGIALLNAVLTIAFRWDSSIPLGFKKK